MDDAGVRLWPRVTSHVAFSALTAAVACVAPVLVATDRTATAAIAGALWFVAFSAPAAVFEHATRTTASTALISVWARRTMLVAAIAALASAALSRDLRGLTPAALAAFSSAVGCAYLAAILRGNARARCAARVLVISRASRLLATGITGAALVAWGPSTVPFALLAGALVEVLVLSRPALMAGPPLASSPPSGLLAVFILLVWAHPVLDVLAATRVETPPAGDLAALAVIRVAAIAVMLWRSASATAAFERADLASVAGSRALIRGLPYSLAVAGGVAAGTVAAGALTVTAASLAALTGVVLAVTVVLHSWILAVAPRALLATVLSAALLATLGVVTAGGGVGFAAGSLVGALLSLAVAAGVVVVLARRLARPRFAIETVSPDDDTYVVSVVLPSFNAGDRLVETITGCQRVFSDIAHEVLVVDDGSTDGSTSDLEQRCTARVLRKANGGKGSALAVGAAAARGTYVVFLDADGDIDPSFARRYFDRAVADAADAVVGSKSVPGAKVEVARVRRLYSWGFQTLVRVALRSSVRDTQVGCKCIRRRILLDALPGMTEHGFLFDLELMAMLARRGAVVREEPVAISGRMSSTISLRAVVAMLAGTLVLGAQRPLSPASRP